MKRIILSLIFTFTALMAQDQVTTVESLTHSDLANTPSPTASEDITLFEFDIKTRTDLAYQHIQQGYGHLVCLWDMQAYRFFLEALKEDPDSIMATAGIVMTLRGMDRHLKPHYKVAVEHLSDLLETGAGTTFERNFSLAILNFARGDGVKLRRMLKYTSELEAKGSRFARLLYAYIIRDGYTTEGKPRSDQVAAVKILQEELQETPDDSAVILFNITAQIDNPRPDKEYRQEMLTLAHKLVQKHPDFPVYHKLLAFCALQVGDPFTAHKYYHQAGTLYQSYLKEQNLPLRNCRDLITCRLGAMAALVHQEKYTEVAREHQELLKLRTAITGSPALTDVAFEWEVDTLLLRSAIISGEAGAINREITAMKERLKGKGDDKVVHLYWRTLLQYAQCRQALTAQKTQDIAKDIKKFIETSTLFLEPSIAAYEQNADAQARRARNLVKVLEAELLARYELTKNTPSESTFLKYLDFAQQNQRLFIRLDPPLWAEPIELLKADYLMEKGNYKDALKAADSAYRRMPNNYQAMKKLQTILTKLDRPKDAKAVSAQIATFERKKAE